MEHTVPYPPNGAAEEVIFVMLCREVYLEIVKLNNNVYR